MEMFTEQKSINQNTESNSLIGLLLDTSGSMESFYSEKINDFDSKVKEGEIKIEKIHSIIDLLEKVVFKDSEKDNNYSNNKIYFKDIFCTAFGLRNQNTCDLIAAFEEAKIKYKKIMSNTTILTLLEKNGLYYQKIKSISDGDYYHIFETNNRTLSEYELEKLLSILPDNFIEYEQVYRKNKPILGYIVFIQKKAANYTLHGIFPLKKLLYNSNLDCDKYINSYVSNQNAGFIFNEMANDIDLKTSIIHDLPDEVKIGSEKYNQLNKNKINGIKVK